MSRNITSLSFRKGLEENLFEEIQKLSEQNTNDINENIEQIADEFHIGKSSVLGAMSFYDFTRKENLNKKVHVCNGTACMCAGTQDKVKNILKNHFDETEIGHVSCLGRCHENSAFMYNGNVYSADTEAEIENIISQKNTSYHNSYHVECFSKTQILTKDDDNLSSFYSVLQKYENAPQMIISEMKASGLRGRGGAGFPFHLKLEACSKESSEQKYIVCNADEGDPGAYSDMYLMEHQPHKVLFGMLAAGLATGADTGILYIRKEYPNSIATVNKAIEEFNNLGLYNFTFKVISGAGAYVCGEETALLNSIEGKRAEVRVRPPYPTTAGLYNKPTVLSNVETFANINWILQNGGKEYARLGTERSTGVKLVSLDSSFNRPGIYEVEMGTPLADVVHKMGQGMKTKVKAFQIGGPLGGIVPFTEIEDLTIDFESFQQAGYLLGHASIVGIPEDFPMLKYIHHLFEFTAAESCGKCYPCRIGSVRGKEMIEEAMANNTSINTELFNDLLETLELGSLCALGGGLPLPVRNILEKF
ncbi:MAG: formate dehydrogenase [Chlorobi bacterium]|nr:formate dehydrogenase [Chlorobiota bacterium]